MRTDQATIQVQNTVQATDQDCMENSTARAALTENEFAVLSYMQENPQITTKEISISLNWKILKVKYYVSKLKAKKAITSSGSSHKGNWVILI